jgi:membrane fusion protein (multidrug efflux system)
MLIMEKDKKKKVSPIIKYIIGFFAVVIIGLGAYGVYWYIQTTTYVTLDNGKISGNIISVIPKVAGKVVDVKVKEGDKVKSGEVLFVVDSQPLQIQLDQAGAALDVAKAQLAKTEGGARAQDVAAAQSMVDQSKASLSGAQIGKSTLQSSLNDANSNYSTLLKSMSSFKDSNGNYNAAAAIAKLDTLVANKVITDAQYTEKVNSITQLFSAKTQLESTITQLKGQINVASTQIQALNAGVSAANSKLGLTNAGATSYDIQILEDQVKIAQSNYDLAKINFDNANVTATVDGIVAQVDVIVGSTAAPTLAAVSIMDTSKIQIAGTVTEDKIDKIQVGQTVNIKIPGVPGVAFSGKVSEVGLATDSAVNPLNTVISFSSTSTTVELPVKIDFDTQGKDIKPGMSVNADIKIK